MTTIVSLSSNKETILLGDQGITSDLMHPNMNKIVRQMTWVIGVSGEDRICDVIQYAVKWPKVPDLLVNKDYSHWLSWMVQKVIPIIQQTIESSISKSSSTLENSEAILVTHGKSFLIGETLGLTQTGSYWAIGSGQKVAIGALAANQYTTSWDKNLENNGRDAISVAQQFDPYTRGNITGYRSLVNGHVIPV
jgi:ATP-dependent protease HslVU (ClpYQ) peptidase subunit